MDTGTSPFPWRDVQLWDRSPGRNVCPWGRFGAQLAKLQSGGGGGWTGDVQRPLPPPPLELRGEGGTGATLG